MSFFTWLIVRSVSRFIRNAMFGAIFRRTFPWLSATSTKTAAPSWAMLSTEAQKDFSKTRKARLSFPISASITFVVRAVGTVISLTFVDLLFDISFR